METLGRGTIVCYFKEKGFGFIRSEGKDFYFHINERALVVSSKTGPSFGHQIHTDMNSGLQPEPRTKVVFQLSRGKDSRLQAAPWAFEEDWDDAASSNNAASKAYEGIVFSSFHEGKYGFVQSEIGTIFLHIDDLKQGGKDEAMGKKVLEIDDKIMFNVVDKPGKNHLRANPWWYASD